MSKRKVEVLFNDQENAKRQRPSQSVSRIPLQDISLNTVIKNTNEEAELVAPKAVIQDSGVYSCNLRNDLGPERLTIKAINKAGESEPSSSLGRTKITEHPNGFKPEFTKNFTHLKGSILTLFWNKPHNCPITGYWVEKKEKGSNRWITCNMKPIQATTYIVPSLIEHQEYEFRVLTEFKAGLSEPAPRYLVVENVKHKSVTLSWKPPASGLILNYIVEKLELTATVTIAGGERPAENWTKCSTTRLNHFTDETLLPLHKYQFRVIAQNLEGRSKPCEPTSVITTLGQQYLITFNLFAPSFLKCR